MLLEKLQAYCPFEVRCLKNNVSFGFRMDVRRSHVQQNSNPDQPLCTSSVCRKNDFFFSCSVFISVLRDVLRAEHRDAQAGRCRLAPHAHLGGFSTGSGLASCADRLSTDASADADLANSSGPCLELCKAHICLRLLIRLKVDFGRCSL